MEQEPLSAAPADGKLVSIITASILIAALIAGGGVYAYQHSQQTKSQQDMQAQIDSLNSQLSMAKQAAATSIPAATASPKASATTSPIASSTPDPTAGWQTYSDVSTGVNLKYPTDWAAEKASNSINFRSTEAVNAVKKNVQNFQADVIVVYYTASTKELLNEQGKPSNSLTLESWLASQKGTPVVQSYTKITMPLVNYGPYSVYAVVNSYPNTTYYLEISGKVFNFSNASGTLTDIDKNILQSIKVT